MFAQVGVTDTERLREIDVANENQRDHSHYVAHFVATDAYRRVTQFVRRVNDACVGKTHSQVLLSPPCQSLIAVIDTLSSIVSAHPPLRATDTGANGNRASMSRFGNAAFRNYLTDVQSQTPKLIRELLSRYIDTDTLPNVSGHRLSLALTDSDSPTASDSHGHGGKTVITDDTDRVGHSKHIHLPSNVPQKVIDSLIARGDLPADYQHHNHGHSESGSDSHAHQHSPERRDQPQSQAHENHHAHHHTDSTVNTRTVKSMEPHADAGATAINDSVAGDRLDRCASLLCLYLNNSLGDIRRIDYGTGHELNFFCFLYCLHHLGLFTNTHATTSDNDSELFASLALHVFARYVRLMRQLQTSYLLEPAGSRGVWGLDDYCFLPFLLGSAQLIDHPRIKPKSVRVTEVLELYSQQYLYLESIQFVMRVKTNSFAEHSPMLNDITIVKSWQQVNTGLMKMYEAEVLRKYPIIQHFLFSELLAPRLVQAVVPVSVPQPELCCSDSIHFPSALAARQVQ